MHGYFDLMLRYISYPGVHNGIIRTAVKRGRLDICQKYYTHSIGYIEVSDAVRAHHIDIVKHVLTIDQTECNRYFLVACKTGDLEMIQLLIEHGATAYRGGMKMALEAGNLSILRYLLDLEEARMNAV